MSNYLGLSEVVARLRQENEDKQAEAAIGQGRGQPDLSHQYGSRDTQAMDCMEAEIPIKACDHRLQQQMAAEDTACDQEKTSPHNRRASTDTPHLNTERGEELKASDWLKHPGYVRYWRMYNVARQWFHAHSQFEPTSGCSTSSKREPIYQAPHSYHANPQQSQPNAGAASRNVSSHVDLDPHHSTTIHNHSNSPTACPSTECSRESFRPMVASKWGGSAVAPRPMGDCFNQNDNNLELSTPDVDCEAGELEMVIPPSMIEFMRISAKHRVEREKKKAETRKTFEETRYVDASQMTSVSSSVVESTAAPKPGSGRAEQMKAAYGLELSPLVHALEVSIQMDFDRQTDLEQPPYWPNIPLNIKFG